MSTSVQFFVFHTQNALSTHSFTPEVLASHRVPSCSKRRSLFDRSDFPLRRHAFVHRDPTRTGVRPEWAQTPTVLQQINPSRNASAKENAENTLCLVSCIRPKSKHRREIEC